MFSRRIIRCLKFHENMIGNDKSTGQRHEISPCASLWSNITQAAPTARRLADRYAKGKTFLNYKVVKFYSM